MKFTLEPVSGPDIEPVTLAEMKRHLRCFDDVTVEDDDINGLIVTARQWAENYTGRALIDQTWRLTLDGQVHGDRVQGYNMPYFVGFGRNEWLHWMRRGEILLRRAPILAITSFKSVDAAGVETDIDAATYELREKDSKWPRIVKLNAATWPPGTLRIQYRAGFADRLGSPKEDVAKVPTRFKQGIKLYAEALYDRDQYTMELLLKVAEEVLKPERADLQFA